MKNIAKVLVLLGLLGCQLPCAEINKVTDLGPLPEGVLAIVPYEDEEAVSFLHTGDTLVQLEVSRETRRQYEYYRDECNDLTTIYEIDVTSMATADSALSILTWVANLAPINWYQVMVNNSNFLIPASPNAYLDADILDSLLVNGTVYYNVCRIPRTGVAAGSSGDQLADTVFYNTEFGYLEIVMEDGSRYSRHE